MNGLEISPQLCMNDKFNEVALIVIGFRCSSWNAFAVFDRDSWGSERTMKWMVIARTLWSSRQLKNKLNGYTDICKHKQAYTDITRDIKMQGHTQTTHHTGTHWHMRAQTQTDANRQHIHKQTHTEIWPRTDHAYVHRHITTHDKDAHRQTAMHRQIWAPGDTDIYRYMGAFTKRHTGEITRRYAGTCKHRHANIQKKT